MSEKIFEAETAENAAEAENSNAETAKSEKGKNTYTLKTPFEYEDKTYTEFKFNFEKLNGKVMLDVESELRDRGMFIISPESDTAFIITMAAKAANVSDDVLTALPIADFLAIKRMTQRFLNSKG